MRKFLMAFGIELKLAEQRALIELHKGQKVKKIADRIKAIILLSKGFSPIEIEDILLMSERHVRRCRDIFLEKGMEALLQVHFKGSEPELDKDQLGELDEHLQQTLYQTAKEICGFVKRQFRVRYTPNGIVPLLHRLGYVHKKAKGIPGRCDLQMQQKFVRRYTRMRKSLGKGDKIYFLDASHPTFNTVLACGWIKKGEEKSVRTNSGRFRINLHGAWDPVNKESICLQEKHMKAEDATHLLDELRRRNSRGGLIYAILDNGNCYIAKRFRDHAKKLKIRLVFLPSYSPNLNLIERLWKFFRQKILYNRFHEDLFQFRLATTNFFRTVNHRYRRELQTLMTENFHVFPTPEPAN